MKNHRPLIVPSSLRAGARGRGLGDRSRNSSALLLVLGMMVLFSALILAFLASVGTQMTTSQIYANGATVKQLADSTTQLAISQIVTATGNTNSTLAWASQPGMIRTYDTSGNPQLFYKLYSSPTMVVSGSGFVPANETPPATWDSTNNAGLYVDLNSPVSSSGTNYFPIIDPRALATQTTNSVEGFNYTSAVDQVALPSAGTSSQRLPMPVPWLYVLQNGAIVAPVSGSAGTVTFDTSNSTNTPSASNPIVGRIAFWTDDETCKVNLNTASEGTFWDRPWANTTTEQNYSTAIPAQNEFQRYPGHPAKTSLSSVFGPLGFPTPWPNSAWYFGIPSATQTTNTNELAAYYGLAPRVTDGGTEGGNVNETTSTGGVNSAFVPITPDADRLYASTDEVLYGPTYSTTPRTVTTLNGVAMNSSVVEKAKFFITAHSRAPELNLFGKPRLTLWPIQSSTTDRNAKDQLIAFCSTINTFPFYFQRFNAYSDTGVAPSTVGGASSASSQSATSDWVNVARNQTLYGYLSQIMQQNIPGFGGSFSAKYPNTYQQLVTEMFDMIRSGVNSYNSNYNYVPTYLDPGEGQVIPIQPGNGTQGFGRTTTIVGAALVFFRSNVTTTTCTVSKTGVVTTDPSQVTALNPSGVVITPAPQIGATLILNPYTPSPGLPPLNPNLQYVVTGLSSFTVTGSTGPQNLPFPADSVPPINTVTARSEFSGGANCTPYFGVVPSLRYDADASVGKGTGSTGDETKSNPTSTSSVNPVTQYPFTTVGGATMGASDTTFNFSGGAVTIKVYAGADVARANCIQTINMSFPAATGLLIPTIDPLINGVAGSTYNFPRSPYMVRVTGGPSQTMNTTFRNNGLILSHAIPNQVNTGTGGGNSWLSGTTVPLGNDSNGNPVTYWVQDITRGMEADPNGPAKGDLRIYAALNNVPATYFRACTAPDGSAAYSNPVFTNVQTLRDEGLDAGGIGGFGYDNSQPLQLGTSYANTAMAGVSGAPYPHYPTFNGGSTDKGRLLLNSTFETGVLVPQASLAAYGGTANDGSFTGTQEYRSSARPATANGLTAALTSGGFPGDWDNMTGLLEDGAFINKPDEGNGSTVSNTANVSNLSAYYGGVDISGGYFSNGFSPTLNFYNIDQTSNTTSNISTFSPNRQVSSAVMFGSLPTGIDPTGATAPQPWQTLLFCPNPPAGTNHPGLGVPGTGPPYTTPPDQLILDFFTMPIVEPYAISEPFSTAGKINMNYQILPFTYITRDTGVRAVLKATRIMAIPQSVSTVTTTGGPSYKDGQRCKYEMRYNINPDETVGTLAGFQNRFANGDIFHSAAEICSIYLVPEQIPNLSTGMVYPAVGAAPATYAATAAWWNNFLLTGDNVREFPYGDLYARLTTKSNTYTVHVRVQTLKKIPTTAASQWVEGRDMVTGEYRGSSLVERYVDTSDTTLPDFAASGAPSVEGYYKIHIVSSKKFAP